MKTKLITFLVAPAIVIGSLSGVMLTDSTAYAVAGQTSPGEIAAARATILADTNSYRASLGLPTLVANSGIDTMAQNWSYQQAENGAMSHNPNVAAQLPGGWTGAAENVAEGFAYANVTAGWIASPGHRANIEGNYTDIGIGYFTDTNGRTFYTQVFARYASTTTAPGIQGAPAVAPAGPGQASVLFYAPAQTGNLPISSYNIRAVPQDGGAVINTTVGAAYVEHTIAGLRGGIVYEVSVQAVNAVGAGAWSEATNVVTISEPGVDIVSVTPTPYTADITWSTAANGDPVTGHTVTFSGEDAVTLDGTAASYSFANLIPGRNYTGTVTATNSVGSSAPANFSITTPAVAPDAPPATAAFVQDKTNVNVSWDLPVFDGGANLQNYTVTLSAAGYSDQVATVAAGNLNHVFSGVARGVTYTYTVTANNSVGASTPANGSIEVPYTAPTSVNGLTSELADEQTIRASWTAPVDTGGTPSVNYIVSLVDVSDNSVVDTVTITDTNVEFGPSVVDPSTSYTISVVAHNTFFGGLATYSNVINVPATPTAPGLVGDHTLTGVFSDQMWIDWQEPTDNGGAAVTGYFVEVFDEDNILIYSVNTSDNFAFVNSLSPYRTYRTVVSAINSKGTGIGSTVSARTLAEVPAGFNANASFSTTSDHALSPTLTIVNPISTGGDSDITYSVTATTAAGTVSSTFAMSQNVTTTYNYTIPFEVTSGETVEFEIVASNSGGDSAPYTFTKTAPVVSDAPTVTATATTNSVNVDILDPADFGTFGYDHYNVTVSDAYTDEVYAVSEAFTNPVVFTLGSAVPRNVDVKVTVTPYTHPTGTLRGTDGVSNVLNIPATAPHAVSNLVINPLDNAIEASWDEPYNGGSALADYTVTLYDDITGDPVDMVQVATNSHTFDNLPGGMPYYVTVVATNNVGDSSTVTSVTQTTNPEAPAAPTSVTAAITASDTVSFDIVAGHNGGATISHYNYVITDVTTSEDVFVGATVDLSNEWVDGVPGHRYLVTVSAVNVRGAGATTDSNTVKQPAVVADAPTVVTVAFTDTEATFDFLANANGGADITSYNLIFDNAAPVNIPAVNGNVEGYVVAGLTALTPYLVQVEAVNEAGTSPIASTVVETDYRTPADVQNIAVTELFAGKTARITWPAIDVAPTEAPFVEYSVVITDSNNVVVADMVTGTNMFVYEVGYGFTGEVSVTAHILSKTSNAVTESFTTSAAAPEAPVTSVTVDADNGYVTTINWNTPVSNGAAITEYNVVVEDDSNNTVVLDETVTGNTFDTTLLAPGGTYNVYVTAVNSAGTSASNAYVFNAPLTAPSAPLNVAVNVGNTDDVMDVTWDNPANTGGSANVSYAITVLNTATNESNTFTETDNDLTIFGAFVTYNTNYVVTVTAINEICQASASAVNYTTPIVAPDAVTNATVAFSTNNRSVNIAWTAPANTGGELNPYILTIVKDGEVTPVYSTTVNGTTFDHTFAAPLDPMADYIVTITSTNSAGSADVQVTKTTNMVAPAAVTAVTAVNGNLLTVTIPATTNTGGAVTVDYSFVVTDDLTNDVVSNVVGVSANNPVLVGVEYGGNYTVTTTVTNTAGSSSTTASVNVPATLPDAVTNVTVNVANNNSIEFTANAPAFDGGAPITAYNYVVSQGGLDVASGSFTTPSGTIPNTGIAPNVATTLTLIAVNSAGASAANTSAFDTNIVAPAAVTEVNIANVGADTVTVEFTAPTNIGGDNAGNFGYTVTLDDPNSEVGNRTATVTPGDTVTLTFTGLDYATEYTATIEVFNTVASNITVTDTVKTDGVAPTAPASLDVVASGETKAKLTWTAPTNTGGATITGYRINYADTTATFAGSVVVDGIETSTVIDVAEKDSIFNFTITAINQWGESASTVGNTTYTSVPSTQITPLPEDLFMESLDTYTVLELVAQTAGTITVALDNVVGTWFAGVAYSTPVQLGWAFQNNGTLTYSTAGLPAGNHTLAVYDVDGNIVGVTAFNIAEAVTPENGGVTPAKPGNMDSKNVTKDGKLDKTGTPVEPLMFAGLGTLLLAAGASLTLFGARRKKAGEAN